MSNTNVIHPKVILILGLHHSGTTIVWKSFRKNPQLLCFDEPFTTAVGRHFPTNNYKRTFDEYIRMFGDDPQSFWNVYSPFTPWDELDQYFSEAQSNYLNTLIGKHDNIVIDDTHLHLHCEDIPSIIKNAYVIHLFRRARGFVTSHLHPKWSRIGPFHRKLIRQLRYRYNELTFWSRSDFPAGVQRDDVIGSNPASKFGILLSDAGYDVKRIYESPAYVKLLAFWHFHFRHMESIGPRTFGDRFISLPYEDFAQAPRDTMDSIYRVTDTDIPKSASYDDVHFPKPGFKPLDKHWKEGALIAGFSESEIESLL